MELTKNETALIEAIREAEIAPGNIVLWFTAKKYELAEEIDNRDTNRAKRDRWEADVLQETYDKLIK